ncbi:MAG: sigma-E processing peptidase SpoIIGA, partial [Clostridia bacterium]|nr:sigma-E processing peptidase SpoIIGA [Clostridia bacterium]
GIYSVFMFFPQVGFLYFGIFKIFILFGISYLVFGGENLKEVLKRFGVFLAVNLSLGGALLALIFLTDFGTAVGSVVSGRGIYLNLSPVILVLGVALTYTLLGVYQKMRRQALYEKSLVKRFKITYKNKSCEVNVFMDTGCRIKDPISDRGALIVEYDKVKCLLSDREREVVEREKGIDRVYETGMRVLPYSTINGDNMICAIVADKLESEDRKWEKVCIGLIMETKFEEGYGGIINPRLYLEENIAMEEIAV